MPDLFIEEELIKRGDRKIRKLILSDNTEIVDELQSVDHEGYSINYRTIETTWPVREWNNKISIQEINGNAQVTWVSILDVQNQYRDDIKNRIEGIQESYLYALQLLGEEMEILLNEDVE